MSTFAGSTVRLGSPAVLASGSLEAPCLLGLGPFPEGVPSPDVPARDG